MFEEYNEPLQVWRLMPPSGMIQADPEWTYITTISGRIEPSANNENTQNDQSFQNTTDILIAPYSYASALVAGDGIMDAGGVQRRIVGHPELWKWILPHAACILQRAQWTVVS